MQEVQEQPELRRRKRRESGDFSSGCGSSSTLPLAVQLGYRHPACQQRGCEPTRLTAGVGEQLRSVQA